MATTPRTLGPVDSTIELAEANMSGRIDATVGRTLPTGVDMLCTPEWLRAYTAGRSTVVPGLVRRCSICGDPSLSQPCGPCRREAAGL